MYHVSLSAILIYLRRLREAEDAARKALELKPDLAVAEVNLGIALMEQGAHDEALVYGQKAEKILPHHVENLMLLSALYARSDDYDSAKAAIDRILAAHPGDVRATSEMGMLQLLFGHYAEGWENYKATYWLSDVSKRRFDKPEWKGEFAPDATVFIQINQGVGDCIQFLRYLTALKERVGRVVLECHAYTRPLYENHPAVAETVLVGEPAQFDYWVCSTLLAGLFWDERGAMPAESYLTADAERSEPWRRRFAADGPDFKVGIVWAGNAGFINDHLRTTVLESFAPLKEIPNVRLYSLQKGEPAKQAQSPPDGMTLIDLADDLRDYGDTAAAVANLDLIISVDTSVAHLAGALGKPVWTLIPSVPEWRWLRQGETTDWYPSMRLFPRQNVRRLAGADGASRGGIEPAGEPGNDGRNGADRMTTAETAYDFAPPPVYSIDATNLTKRYGQKIAAENVSLHIREGEFYGFLGPNGAGKSTTIKMLATLLKPDTGQAKIIGYDLLTEPLAIKAQIGVLPEETNLYERLTGQEFLLFSGQMYGLDREETRRRAADLIALMELAEVKDKLIVDYSMGMKKKTAFAAALIHRPRVLFLDEPFNGIDPISVRSIRNALRQLTERGATIFISSHVMEVIEKLCTRVAIINHGRIVGEGTLDELRDASHSASDTSLEDVFLKLVEAKSETGSLDWL